MNTDGPSNRQLGSDSEPGSAQAEAERYFALRGARAKPGEALRILDRAGVNNPPRDDDKVE